MGKSHSRGRIVQRVEGCGGKEVQVHLPPSGLSETGAANVVLAVFTDAGLQSSHVSMAIDWAESTRSPNSLRSRQFCSASTALDS